MSVITFLGTGTSQGVPVISCRCSVCRSTDPRDKRLRTSAMVETGGVRIVIDAGPDFRQQMLREDVERIDGILLTHGHKDHTGGIDDVRAFNYTQRRAVDIYAEPDVQRVIEKDFDYAFGDNKYPGAPDINLHSIDAETPFFINGVKIIPVRGMHHKLPVLGFRIGDMAYLTDFNYISDENIGKLKGIKVLVVNALRHEPHLSHFTLEEALSVAAKTGAERTYLTHVSHQLGRYKDVQSQLPPGVWLACDGLKVEF